MLEYTESQYQGALADLDALSRMDRDALLSHDVHGEYGSAIVNVAKIFNKPVDQVVCDLIVWRVRRVAA